VRDEGGARGDGAGKVVVGWLELPRLSLFLKARVVLRKLQSLAFDPFVGQNPEVPRMTSRLPATAIKKNTMTH
jgi:hypothetical protein